MRRVLVVGPCGAGKSTASIAIARQLDLPVYHIDQLNWQPGWVEGGKPALRETLAEIVVQDRWLIDGTYGGTLPQRLERADTVIYLDYPVWLCVIRLLRRIWTYHGRPRPDMPPDCPERLDLAFLWYVIRWNSGPRLRLEQALHGHENKIVRLTSPRAFEAWANGLISA